jgi:hypothetical protein
MSDALQVAREIEFDLWYVAQSLGAVPEQDGRKSHVYVFRDEKEWQKFLTESHPPAWTYSFALRDNLFLDLGAAEGGFDSHTLAHETTPAIVARLYDTSAKFVRYLFNKYPKELFPKFVDRVIAGAPATEALVEIYGNEFSDMAEFEKRFSRFTR